MSNFAHLQNSPEYALFATACIEAERVLSASPAMCAVGCRKALELAVKWVYSADTTMKMPYKDNLQSLIHEPSFRFALDAKTWGKLPFIINLGNLAVNTEKQVSKSDGVLALSALFEFVQWIEYCYGEAYEDRTFSEISIPSEKIEIDSGKIKEQESILSEKDSEIEKLRAEIEKLSKTYTAEKETKKKERVFTASDLSEFATRKKYIDVDLKLLGWVFGDDCREEVQVDDMAQKAGQSGFCDYVLYGKDNMPLAVIEAKQTSVDIKVGERQAELYADSLERQYGARPMIFLCNGFETDFWEGKAYPIRKVSGIFSKSDLEKLMARRKAKKDLAKIVIDDKITDRYYQKEAIKAVCENFTTGHRKSLLVMATGTGKTRTASSLTDVLSRGGHITNVLFLADRTALVKQAKDDFRIYLPDMSLCNLLSNKEDKNARIVFSTYPTILNAIDSAKTESGERLFSPAHFDLIIVDEAHRSIFKKYRAIFEYFDALIVGLTATPKTDVDRNTYDFFDMQHGVPTYAYDYETAVEKDKVLVPYYPIETATKFLEEGIKYDELSDIDKERFEEDFAEDEGLPDFIPSPALNEFVFNKGTVDIVLEDLMTKGIKIEGGDKLGKTIIFAQNKKHAQFIVDRFNALYPQYKGTFARRIVCDDNYAGTLIEDFKVANKMPQIAVSVDMMDTGIDVPEVVNLVFFKKVRSKTKFWQMIGRGTRLCKGLSCIDSIDGAYTDKRRLYIFDYCGNFDFFRMKSDGIEGNETFTLSENIFIKQTKITVLLQDRRFPEDGYVSLRNSLIDTMVAQINALNTELISVKLQRKYTEKFNNVNAFVFLTEQSSSDLQKYIAPLVWSDEVDEYAKRFDNFMYGLMLSQLESSKSFKKYKNQLCNLANDMQQRASIPQIKEKLPVITTINTDEFWADVDILRLEFIRCELRELVKFLIDEGGKNPVYTDLTDVVLATKEGEGISSGYDFEDYRLKVNRYIEQHKDETAIWKLRNNIKLTAEDYQTLSDIFTSELGSIDDYKKEFRDTPFGLLIRKIAKLERAAAMQVFSAFISEHGLNQHQIVFVEKVIDYVVQNGYLESVSELMKPPFDKPDTFIKLFEAKQQMALIALVNEIKENALVA